MRDNRFVARVSGQAFLIGTLVSHAIDALTLAEIRHALREHELSPATLDALNEVIRSNDIRGSMRHGIRVERIAQQDAIQRLFTDDGNGNGHIHPQAAQTLGSFDVDIPDGPLATLASFVIADRRQNEAAFDDLRDIALAQVDAASVVDLGLDWEGIVNKYPRRSYPSVNLLAPAVARSIQTTLIIEADANATRLMIALERHHRAKGADAATLDALVPEFLSTLHADTISGRPWIYRPLPQPDEHGRRYLLYSVGTDLADNGGDHAEDARTRGPKGTGKDYLVNRPRE